MLLRHSVSERDEANRWAVPDPDAADAMPRPRHRRITAFRSRTAEPPWLLLTTSDVVAHAVAYAVLAVAMLRGLTAARLAAASVRTALLAAVLATAYGAVDEFHQSLVAGRHVELRDVAADALGATADVALRWAWGTVVGRSRESVRRMRS